MTATARARREAWSLALLALVVRLVLVALLQPEPVWDGRYFDALARHLAHGDGYAIAGEGAGDLLRPTAHYPVGYPALLALAYRVLGDTVGVAFLLQSLLGAALVLVVHTLVRRSGDDRAAFAAALVTALHPGLVLQAPLVMAEPLAALLYAGLVICILHLHAQLAWAVLAGACGGFATLVRPQTLLVVPALVVVTLITERRRTSPRAWAGRALLVAASFAAVVTPWALRNARVLDGPALVSTNGGWNVAIGALPGATGRYRGLPANHGCEAVSGEVAVDRCLGAKAREAIARDPGAFFALVPAKLSYAVDYEAFPIEALHEAQPELISEPLRRTGWRVLMVAHQALLLATAFEALRRRSHAEKIAAAVLAVVPMALLGRPSSAGIAVALALALSSEGGLALRLIGTTFALFLATHAVFFGEDRYHVVVEALLAAALFLLRARPLGDLTPKRDEASSEEPASPGSSTVRVALHLAFLSPFLSPFLPLAGLAGSALGVSGAGAGAAASTGAGAGAASTGAATGSGAGAGASTTGVFTGASAGSSAQPMAETARAARARTSLMERMGNSLAVDRRDPRARRRMPAEHAGAPGRPSPRGRSFHRATRPVKGIERRWREGSRLFPWRRSL